MAAAVTRSLVVSGSRHARLHRLAELGLDGEVDDRFQVGAREVVGLLGEMIVIDVLRPACPGRSSRRMAARACKSGGGTKRMRSNRPGRRNAGVEMPGRIRRRQNQDAFVAAADPIELGEELVDELAPAAGAQVGPAGGQGIDLVEEEHARRILSRLLEQCVQIPLAVADPHLEHVVDPDGQEPRMNLAGRGPGQVGLAATRRPIHQDAAADRLAVGLVKLGMVHRMNDLDPDLFLDRFHPADVAERRGSAGRLDRRCRRGLGPCLTVTRPSTTSLVLRVRILLGSSSAG